jgi:cation diffusion facilitator family transporter
LKYGQKTAKEMSLFLPRLKGARMIMKDFLIKRFIRDYENTKDASVRQQYGNLGSITGIVVNLLMFAAKFIIGTITNSVAITADAVNNISDAGSSVISLASFKLASKPADESHPFGHARIEYIASSLVAVIILFIGLELIKESIHRISNPTVIEFNIIAVVVLLIAIAAKLWLYRFSTDLGKRIDSTVIQASAADSLADVMATSAVLLSTILSPLLDFQLDGYIGIAVALFIMFSGLSILKDTIDRLLGQKPPQELIDDIIGIIRQNQGVIGVHDMVVHEYGPNRSFASAHVEVDARVNILESHDLIDNIEREVAQKLGVHLVIHMDPVVIDDPYVNELHQLTIDAVKTIDDSLTIHDFRVVKGPTHSNVIFDITVPFGYRKSDQEIREQLTALMKEKDPRLYLIITIDRSYI